MLKSIIFLLSLITILSTSACDVERNLKSEHKSVAKIPSTSLDQSLQTKEDQAGMSNNPINEFTADELTFQNIKTKVLDNNCINCHTGKHQAYTLYQIVKLSSKDMLDRMKTRIPIQRMPSGRPALPDDLIQLFEAWVNKGAPEFAVQVDDTIPTTETKYSFADIKELVLKPNNCFKCHSHFEDYETAIKNLSSMASTIQSDRMPYPTAKGGTVEPLSKEQKLMWSTWINQGAPKFVGKAELVATQPTEPNWFSIRNDIFGPKCILCHNSFGKRGPNDLSNYESLMLWYQKSPKLFDIEDPENSHFIGAILGRFDDDEFFFDSMPFNSGLDDVGPIAPVSEDELSVIKEWISLGLPQN